MKSVLTKSLVAFSMLAVVAAPSTSEAGIIPWVYNAIFGPSSGPQYRGAYYGGYYAAPNYTYPTMYAPMAAPASYSACSPSWSRQVTYYVPYSPCAVSACRVAACPTSSGKQPTVADDPPSTFVEDPDGKKTGDGTDDVAAPEKKEPFLEPTQLGKEQEVKKVPNTPTTNESDGKSAKSNTNVTDKPKPAPTNATIEEDDAKEDEKKDAKPATKKENGSSTQTLPPLDLERKVTWRVVPKRTRLAIRANVGANVVARQKVKLNVDWVAVESDTRVVSK